MDLVGIEPTTSSMPFLILDWSETIQANCDDTPGAMSMRPDASSLPLTCARAAGTDTARSGQEYQGYDTDRDTKTPRLP